MNYIDKKGGMSYGRYIDTYRKNDIRVDNNYIYSLTIGIFLRGLEGYKKN